MGRLFKSKKSKNMSAAQNIDESSSSLCSSSRKGKKAQNIIKSILGGGRKTKKKHDHNTRINSNGSKPDNHESVDGNHAHHNHDKRGVTFTDSTTGNNNDESPELEHHNSPAGAIGVKGKPATKKHITNATKSAGRGNSKITKKETSKETLIEEAIQNKSYGNVPLMEITSLPRGGVSIETQAAGRVQFGIPPETIKDSMSLGLPVPLVYIVPVDRFCREMGPALGVNLAEFEFPAYFNFFVQRLRCTLIVDSDQAEQNIRRVFSETLLGPVQFRRQENRIDYEPEDFADDFPKDAIPNLAKELEHFRKNPDGSELTVDTLLQFRHFNSMSSCKRDIMGLPPHYDATDLEKDQLELEWEEGSSDDGDGEGTPLIEANAERYSGDGMEKALTYQKIKREGELAIVYPPKVTQEQKDNQTCKRLEIFKIAAGTEYILHDIDENNVIIGKARISGSVRVSECVKIIGYESYEDSMPTGDPDRMTDNLNCNIPRKLPPSFHPPSFGLTVLGNSSGFDTSGSTSGYVLWINGRGIMIDPPPYSSATLEREGIRPGTIVGIILTHCHADHDAGAFQKVLTGSPVVVITTPTIYKSFIRKYAALSNLSPALLRHCHRYKPAIIGKNLKFQGAHFSFTYTLHAIPCVGFRVEWSGRSMVFTGDHMNIPSSIDALQEKGVLSKGRADDLRHLPLQECDLLLHESGAPPIHTPLDVLLKLPAKIKQRLYVVHTAALPPDCELQVAPTGTKNTIRLDQLRTGNSYLHKNRRYSIPGENFKSSVGALNNESLDYSHFNTTPDHNVMEDREQNRSFASFGENFMSPSNKRAQRMNSILKPLGTEKGVNYEPPLVATRPSSSSDSWFTLNLLSAVPFLTSLSYSYTMEVLETSRVTAYCMHEVIIPTERRSHLLCVVWEGTMMEKEREKVANLSFSKNEKPRRRNVAVWHAGDYTGPRDLQPEKWLSGESSTSETHDIVAMSPEGVKVITIEFSDLHLILKSGSSLYRKYLERKEKQSKLPKRIDSFDERRSTSSEGKNSISSSHMDVEYVNVIDLLNSNSTFRKLSAVQKRHLESLVEGPKSFTSGERLWRSGAVVDKAFFIVSGTAAFVPKRRNAGSASVDTRRKSSIEKSSSEWENNISVAHQTLGQTMKRDAMKVQSYLDAKSCACGIDGSESSYSSQDDLPLLDTEGTKKQIRRKSGGASSIGSHDDDYNELEKYFDAVAIVNNTTKLTRRGSSGKDETGNLDSDSENTVGSEDDEKFAPHTAKRFSYQDRLANKVLGRLYSRRAVTSGLKFSRGHFLGDVSKMVAGNLTSAISESDMIDDESITYGFGDEIEGKEEPSIVGEMTIHEKEGDKLIVHSSTLAAGIDGCSVLEIPRLSLIPFLDDHPGLLLSLLATQVVV